MAKDFEDEVKDQTNAGQGGNIVEIPTEWIKDVKPSDMGGWVQKSSVAKDKPVILGIVHAPKGKKSDADHKPDVIVKFRISLVNCKTYVSTLLGLYKAKYGEDANPFKKGTTGWVLKDEVRIAFVPNENSTQYPFQMEISNA